MSAEEDGPRGPQRTGVAFALAQLGAHATGLFARRLEELGLTPAQAGLLRLLAAAPGRSQKEIAADLGMPPSRFVPFADELDRRGLIERRRDPEDRRRHAVHLTPDGRDLLDRLARAGREHERQLCRGLSDGEREQLLGLLDRVVAEQGLTPGVHPGYRAG
ncbi:MarR family winged helix-turn-helix transcriptional regulator [Streptomyces sp. NPDC001380]|uniref:MarR family winged helix-turn-helix transcriptional regulator n=1 Tax=Streptomyces sp. NPDC001380 TaxID=3364566 RepID=UPI00369119B9